MPTHLSVTQPSPATVLFTVSNAPSRASITAKLIFYLEVLLRISIFLLVLLIDAAKLRGHFFYGNGTVAWDALWQSSVGVVACRIADNHVWQVVAGCSALVFYLAFRRGHTGSFSVLVADIPWNER